MPSWPRTGWCTTTGAPPTSASMYRAGALGPQSPCRKCMAALRRARTVCVRECLCHGSRNARWPRSRITRELRTHVPNRWAGDGDLRVCHRCVLLSRRAYSWVSLQGNTASRALRARGAGDRGGAVRGAAAAADARRAAAGLRHQRDALRIPAHAARGAAPGRARATLPYPMRMSHIACAMVRNCFLCGRACAGSSRHCIHPALAGCWWLLGACASERRGLRCQPRPADPAAAGEGARGLRARAQIGEGRGAGPGRAGADPDVLHALRRQGAGGVHDRARHHVQDAALRHAHRPGARGGAAGPAALTALALARLVYSVWARTPTRRAHRRCRPASPPALAPLQGLSSVCV